MYAHSVFLCSFSFSQSLPLCLRVPRAGGLSILPCLYSVPPLCGLFLKKFLFVGLVLINRNLTNQRHSCFVRVGWGSLTRFCFFLLVWKPLPFAGNGSSFQPGLMGQGFGFRPWPHYPVRLVFRPGSSRVFHRDLLRLAREGRAGLGWAGPGWSKGGAHRAGCGCTAWKPTCFSKSVGLVMAELVGGNGGSRLNWVIVLAGRPWSSLVSSPRGWHWLAIVYQALTGSVQLTASRHHPIRL